MVVLITKVWAGDALVKFGSIPHACQRQKEREGNNGADTVKDLKNSNTSGCSRVYCTSRNTVVQENCSAQTITCQDYDLYNGFLQFVFIAGCIYKQEQKVKGWIGVKCRALLWSNCGCILTVKIFLYIYRTLESK